MIAHIVPITRLRRATSWWSYRLASAHSCQVGSLVEITFRGHRCLGLVWSLSEDDAHAKETVQAVITRQPLLRLPQRQFIEWLSEAGCTSLSTALSAYLPSMLRKSLSPATRTLLHTFDTFQPTIATYTASPQYLFLVPGERPHLRQSLQERFSNRFLDTFAPASERQELEQWLAANRGEATAVYGRERALFTPFLNLKQVVIQEPEDISYAHEQIPYLNLTEAAAQLATLSQAKVSIRSYLPTPVVTELWSAPAQTPAPQSSYHLIDLNQEALLNPTLLTAIQTTLEAKKNIFLLYNAHDRQTTTPEGERKLLPGIESVRKQLATLLGLPALPPAITLDTRAGLATVSELGLSAILSLDPLLQAPNFADQVHGWSDLCHLLSFTAPCFIQSHNQAHPLIHALRNHQLEAYFVNQIAERRQHHLPPFRFLLACSLPLSDTATEKAETLYTTLHELLTAYPGWQVSHPFPAQRRRTACISLLLFGEPTAPLPPPVRTCVASLPRPWKVERNPWYLV